MPVRRGTRERLEVAGIEPGTATGNKFKATVEIPLEVPEHIELTPGPRLRWRSHPCKKASSSGCLDKFVGLADDDTGRRALAFAQQYGVLGINPKVPEEGEFWYSEPLGFWRYCARQAWALLLVAEEVSKGERGQFEDWSHAPAGIVTDGYFKLKQRVWKLWTLDERRDRLTKWVTIWLQASNLTPCMVPEPGMPGSMRLSLGFSDVLDEEDWDNENRALQWGSAKERARPTEDGKIKSNPNPGPYRCYPCRGQRPSKLFNVLTMQMVETLTSPFGLYQCDREGCGKLFTREGRRLRGDRNRYCSEDCSKKAHNDIARESVRARRLRNKEAKAEESES